MRQVLIYPGENGYWVAECPSLPGCISQGTTREEAVTNIREAIEGYVQVVSRGRLFDYVCSRAVTKALSQLRAVTFIQGSTPVDGLSRLIPQIRSIGHGKT